MAKTARRWQACQRVVAFGRIINYKVCAHCAVLGLIWSTNTSIYTANVELSVRATLANGHSTLPGDWITLQAHGHHKHRCHWLWVGLVIHRHSFCHTAMYCQTDRLILGTIDVRCLRSDTPDGRYRYPMSRSQHLLWLQCCVIIRVRRSCDTDCRPPLMRAWDSAVRTPLMGKSKCNGRCRFMM